MTHATHRPQKTVTDYMALPDDVRAELLDGELYMNPSPIRRHQEAAMDLATELRNHVLASGWGRAWIAPLDVHLPTDDVVQPDVVLVRDGSPCVVDDYIRGTPDLVVEILSPSNPERDLVVKRRRYAEAGVSEYWIVDLVLRGIEVLRLDILRPEKVAYVSAGWFVEPNRVLSRMFPDLVLNVGSVMGK